MKDFFIILLIVGLVIIGGFKCMVYVDTEYRGMLRARRAAEHQLDVGCEKACISRQFTEGDARRIPHMALNTEKQTVDCVCTRGTITEGITIPNPRTNQ